MRDAIVEGNWDGKTQDFDACHSHHPGDGPTPAQKTFSQRDGRPCDSGMTLCPTFSARAESLPGTVLPDRPHGWFVIDASSCDISHHLLTTARRSWRGTNGAICAGRGAKMLKMANSRVTLWIGAAALAAVVPGCGAEDTGRTNGGLAGAGAL